MRLESLRFVGINGFTGERTVQFDPGVTVVHGGNGSGKTAIAWVLYTVFAGGRTGDSGYLRTEAPEAWAEVAFQSGGVRYVLRRDFLTGGTILTGDGAAGPEALFDGVEETQDGGSSPEFREAMDGVLGVGRLNRWLDAALVSSVREGSARPEAEPGTAEPGPDRVEDEILASLEDEYRGLVGDAARGMAGQIQLVEEELEAERRELRGWGERAAAVRKSRLRLEELETQEAEARAAAENRREVYETLRRFQQLAQERVEAEQGLRDLRRERDLVRNHVDLVESAQKKLEEEYGDFLSSGPEIEDSLQSWTEATSRHHEIERRLEAARRRVSEAPRINTVRNGTIAALILGVLGFLACLGAGAPAAGYGVAPLFGFAGFGLVWLKDRKVQGLLQSAYQEITDLEDASEKVLERIEKAKAVLGAVGRHGHPVAIRRAVIRYWKARENVEQLRSERDNHPPLRDVANAYEEVVQALKTIDDEVRELVGRAKYLTGIDESPAALAGEVSMAESQYKASLGRADRLGADCRQIREELDRAASDAPSLGHLERDRNEFEARRRYLVHRAEALKTAIDVLRETAAEYHAGHDARLAEGAGTLFRSFTGGRFESVRLGGNQEVRVVSPDGDSIERHRLSGGVRDQLDLALRLARIHEMGWACTFPLILDGVFLLWDRRGHDQARGVLEAFVASGGQVIVMTHEDSIAAWGQSVIHLDFRPPSTSKMVA